MLFKEIIDVRCHRNSENINKLCGQNAGIFYGKANKKTGKET